MVRLLLATAALMLALAAPAGARTWVVDDDLAQCPAADTAVLQAAVDAAAPGDTIRLCAGSYDPATVGTPDLRLVSAPRHAAVLAAGTQAGVVANDVRGLLVLNAARVRVDGLAFMGGGPPSPCRSPLGAAIAVGAGRAIIAHVRITAFPASRCPGTGLLIAGATGPAPDVALDDVDMVDVGTGVRLQRGRADILRTRIAGFAVPGASPDALWTRYPVGVDARTGDATIRASRFSDLGTAVYLLAPAGYDAARYLMRGNRVHNAIAGVVGQGVFGAKVTENAFDHVREAIEWQAVGSLVDRNQVTDPFASRGGPVGIRMAPPPPDETRTAPNVVRSNVMRGPAWFVACLDQTTGSGVRGTANFWVYNLGPLSIPAGLCARF